MYMEVDGIRLVPGNYGKDCPGNGLHKDSMGNLIECLCDECDFLLCCTVDNYEEECEFCRETECVRCRNKSREISVAEILRRCKK